MLFSLNFHWQWGRGNLLPDNNVDVRFFKYIRLYYVFKDSHIPDESPQNDVRCIYLRGYAG